MELDLEQEFEEMKTANRIASMLHPNESIPFWVSLGICQICGEDISFNLSWRDHRYQHIKRFAAFL
jgi:hypothetical protein